MYTPDKSFTDELANKVKDIRTGGGGGNDWWSPKVGTNYVRFMPMMSKDAPLRAERVEHFIKYPSKEFILCLAQVGVACPICAAIAEIPPSQDLDWANPRTSTRYTFNIMVIESLEGGTYAEGGKVFLYQAPLTVYKDVMLFHSSAAHGNIFDPVNGVPVQIDKPQSFQGKANYRTLPLANPFPVPEGVALHDLKPHLAVYSDQLKARAETIALSVRNFAKQRQQYNPGPSPSWQQGQQAPGYQQAAYAPPAPPAPAPAPAPPQAQPTNTWSSPSMPQQAPAIPPPSAQTWVQYPNTGQATPPTAPGQAGPSAQPTQTTQPANPGSPTPTAYNAPPPEADPTCMGKYGQQDQRLCMGCRSQGKCQAQSGNVTDPATGTNERGAAPF